MSEHLMKYNVHSQAHEHWKRLTWIFILQSFDLGEAEGRRQDEEITYSGEHKPDVDKLLVQGNVHRSNKVHEEEVEDGEFSSRGERLQYTM